MPKRTADDGEAAGSLKKKVKRDGDASDAESQSEGQLQKDNEGNHYLDLGNMKRATVNVFKGKAQMNIREYYTDKNDEVKPGKKGITLNRSQWSIFLSGITSLNEKLETIEAESPEEPKKSKKKSDEKTTKTKKSEKPAKKKKKAESEDEASDDE